MKKVVIALLVIGILGGISDFLRKNPKIFSLLEKHAFLSIEAVPGKVSAGSDYFLTLNEKGDIFGWGDNGKMQLGLDSGSFHTYYSEPFKISSQTSWSYVAAGLRLAYAIDKTGLAWWHPQASEGAADVHDLSSMLPEENQMNYNLLDPNAHWKSIKQSSLFAGGIDDAGKLRFWDDTNLRISTAASHTDEQPVSYLVAASGSEWRDFCLQGATVYAVSSDGSLWKNNDILLHKGEIRSNSHTQESSNDLPIIRLNTKVKFKRVACRENSTHVLMIDENNHLWGFGRNQFGELGNGDGNKYTANNKVEESDPVMLNDKSWADITIGPGFTFGITTDGNLWSWGNNSEGQLGTGNFEHQEIPTLVDDRQIWVAVAASYSGGAATTKEGDIYSWGKIVSQAPKLVLTAEQSSIADNRRAEQSVAGSEEGEMVNSENNAVAENVTAEGFPVFPKLPCNPLKRTHDARHVYCVGDPKRSLWQWDAATGELAEYQIGGYSYMKNQEALMVVEFGQDFVFITDRLELFRKGKADPIDSLTYTYDEHGNSVGVGLASRAISKVSDRSFVMLAQKSYDIKANYVRIVDIANDQLHLESIPDLPGEVRRGVALVALPNNRVMALGGSWSEYLGNEPMTAETYILDLATKSWRQGPKLLEARTHATASSLPDGTVLVAGGWTPKNTWNDTPARSTELWAPATAGFVPGSPLSIGMASHQAQLWPTRNGKQLLLWGGFASAWEGNYSVLALDRNGAWPTVGDWCVANGRSGEMTGVPLEHDGRPFIWCDGENWHHTDPLRLSSWGAESFPKLDPAKGVALRRSGMGFLPPTADRPALFVGGVAGSDSAAVDAVWPDGRLQALAPLNYPRRNAKVFRLVDGSILVASGQAGDASRRTQFVPPIELLPANVPLDQARWIDTGQHLPGYAISRSRDGNLLAVDSSGNVQRLSISVFDGKLVIQDGDSSSLNRVRGGSFAIRELPDGRIVLAGGSVQYHKMALLSEDSYKPDAPDQYVGIGDYAPAHGYEIYDPATKSWSESAPSSATTETLAILGDGRVVKWGRIEAADPWGAGRSLPQADSKKALLEISSADGRTWSPFEAKVQPTIVTDVVQQAPELFVINDELFIAGKRPTDVTQNHWRGIAAVQWFNAPKASWETLWEAEAPDTNWRDNLGRVVIRDFSNGKRVVLPVAGIKEY